MNILITLLPASFGFSFLYLNWKSADKDTRMSNWVGWTLALSSLALFILFEGVEFGLAYGFFGLAIIPLVLALININIRDKQRKITERRTFRFQPIKNRWSNNVIIFIVAIPIALIFSLLSLLVVSNVTGYSEVNKLTLIVLGFPLLWSVIAYLYLYSQQKKMIGSALFLGAIILSGITFT
ncbi:MAG: hypothetical protein JKX81_07795 [Arenicella sp.]|nr:hypothetical protein [Arenicella sp.]